jgi:hypothetical protein
MTLASFKQRQQEGCTLMPGIFQVEKFVPQLSAPAPPPPPTISTLHVLHDTVEGGSIVVIYGIRINTNKIEKLQIDRIPTT